MLGVWACVPALDNYFNEGMQEYWGRGFRSAKLENKLKKIAEFCEGEENLIHIRQLSKEHNLKMAKVLDMCFFEAGASL